MLSRIFTYLPLVVGVILSGLGSYQIFMSFFPLQEAFIVFLRTEVWDISAVSWAHIIHQILIWGPVTFLGIIFFFVSLVVSTTSYSTDKDYLYS